MLAKLKDNRELQHFLQDGQEVKYDFDRTNIRKKMFKPVICKIYIVLRVEMYFLNHKK